jgi:hypothetical protein
MEIVSEQLIERVWDSSSYCEYVSECESDYDSDSENMEPYMPYYYLHPLTDQQAESILQFERPGSWILREKPYAITIRIEDGYIHHTDIHIQFQRTPEVVEFNEDMNADMNAVELIRAYKTFTIYLDKLASVYGLVKKRQIIQHNKQWFHKRQSVP